MLKLMYITNKPEVALIAEKNGVQRIFVDMEYIGKSDRQGGMDTVQSFHTVDDVRKIKKCLTSASLMARCNPIHEKTDKYSSSKEEIDGVIDAGADIIMLPFFKTKDEVQKFISFVDGRAKTLLLIETPEAVENIDEILEVKGIDEVFVGLNDLSLGYGMKFMFELLADGTVERLCTKFVKKGLPYGFGGIAALGKGSLPAERVIAEHYRLGSTCAILSRSFCNTNIITDLNQVDEIFTKGLKEIRDWEVECENGNVDFIENKKQIRDAVVQILNSIG
ncbi:MAG: aldolase [Clostridiales bacterium]|nr:aldolase [Clostridiales bacterium]